MADQLEKSNYETFDVVQGKRIKIQNSQNPSTGYSFQNENYDHLGLNVSKSVSKATTGMLGAPQTVTWSIKGLKPGKYLFTVEYGRSWENTATKYGAYINVLSK